MQPQPGKDKYITTPHVTGSWKMSLKLDMFYQLQPPALMRRLSKTLAGMT